MITSKLTSKARATLPQPVREALGLEPGDTIAYEIVGDRAILSKAARLSENPFALFGEWDNEADRKAYAGL